SAACSTGNLAHNLTGQCRGFTGFDVRCVPSTRRGGEAEQTGPPIFGDYSMSDDASARLGLPYLAAGQLQKHVTLNEALTRLDALTQTAVVSRTVTAQPAAPADGALYILPSDATGADWGGRPAGSLMRAEAGGWIAV